MLLLDSVPSVSPVLDPDELLSAAPVEELVLASALVVPSLVDPPELDAAPVEPVVELEGLVGIGVVGSPDEPGSEVLELPSVSESPPASAGQPSNANDRGMKPTINKLRIVES